MSIPPLFIVREKILEGWVVQFGVKVSRKQERTENRRRSIMSSPSANWHLYPRIAPQLSSFAWFVIKSYDFYKFNLVKYNRTEGECTLVRQKPKTKFLEENYHCTHYVTYNRIDYNCEIVFCKHDFSYGENTISTLSFTYSGNYHQSEVKQLYLTLSIRSNQILKKIHTPNSGFSLKVRNTFWVLLQLRQI